MLYYEATAGCGVGMFVGVSARKRAAPVTLILGRVAALPPPSAALLSPSPPTAHSPVRTAPAQSSEYSSSELAARALEPQM